MSRNHQLTLITREAVSRRDETTSLSHPIINAPDRNEVGVPALTRQDRPTETLLLHVPFGSCVLKIERNGLQHKGVCHRAVCFQVLKTNFQKLGGAYCLSESDICENLIPDTIIQKSEMK